MVNAAIYVPQALRDSREYIADRVNEISQAGYHFNNLILRDWVAVEDCLSKGIVDVVVDDRGEHRAPGRPKAEGLAPVVSLDRQRAETVTRRLSRPNRSSRHLPPGRRDRMGMTTGRIRRILSGEEPAPADFDPGTVDAVRSIASKLWILEHLDNPQ